MTKLILDLFKLNLRNFKLEKTQNLPIQWSTHNLKKHVKIT
jgi:hypothetical protein